MPSGGDVTGLWGPAASPLILPPTVCVALSKLLKSPTLSLLSVGSDTQREGLFPEGRAMVQGWPLSLKGLSSDRWQVPCLLTPCLQTHVASAWPPFTFLTQVHAPVAGCSGEGSYSPETKSHGFKIVVITTSLWVSRLTVGFWGRKGEVDCSGEVSEA